jgi:hypothetical protein
LRLAATAAGMAGEGGHNGERVAITQAGGRAFHPSPGLRGPSASGSGYIASAGSAAASAAASVIVSWAPARSDRLTRIITTVTRNPSSAIPAETRNPREKPSASARS